MYVSGQNIVELSPPVLISTFLILAALLSKYKCLDHFRKTLHTVKNENIAV
jgi:hypothetical protein